MGTCDGIMTGLPTAQLQTGDGSRFVARPLLATDAESLGVYFDNLSESVRGMYGPHPLNTEHARILCDELDHTKLLPFLAIMESGEIGAYFLVHIGVRDGDRKRYIEHGHPLVEHECCTLAPCVADAWQELGLGSAMLPHVTSSIKRLGRQRLVLWGGVRGDNPRAQHFYRKFGFRHVGDFAAGGVNNLDMVLDL